MLSRRSLLASTAALAAGCSTLESPPSSPSPPPGVEIRVAAVGQEQFAFGFPFTGWPEEKYIRTVSTLEADKENKLGPTRAGYRVALRFFYELDPVFYQTQISAKEFEEVKTQALKAAEAMLEDFEADLVTVQPHQAHWLGREGLLLPLDSFSDSADAALEREFFPSVVSEFRSSGVLYGLPIAARPLMLYYDEAFLKEHDVPPPDASWNWHDLAENAARLTTYSEDGTVARWGLVAHLEEVWWALWQNEAMALDPESSQCRLREPAARAALQFVQDLMHKQRVSPPLTGVDLQELLFNRNSLPAMLYDHPLSRFDLRGFRMAPLPRGKVHAVPMRAGLGLAIAARTKRPEAAYTALLGFNRAMQQQASIPAGRAAVARLSEFRTDLRQSEVAAIQHALAHGRAIPEPEPGWEYIAMYEAMQHLGRGEDVAAAVNGACDLVHKYRERQPSP